jgi:hypothetical protein
MRARPWPQNGSSRDQPDQRGQTARRSDGVVRDCPGGLRSGAGRSGRCHPMRTWRKKRKGSSLLHTKSAMWEQHAVRLEEFRAAFVAYDGLVEARRAITGYEAFPPPGVSETAMEAAQQRLSVAAGRATDAANVSVPTMVWSPPPMVGGRPVALAPVENWQRVYDSLGMLTRQDLLNCVDRGIGVCRSKAEEALRYEHGVVGWFAAFLAFPATTRKALGLKQGTKSAGAAMSAAFALQAVVLGVHGSGLWAGVSALGH